ncbi:AraC family transcriptional regulator [bacterium]|nr:AraC family transcriptional regulator [bacterium]
MTQDKIPAISAKALVIKLKKLVGSTDRIMSGTGLDEKWLQLEHAKITPAQYCRVVLNALKESGDAALGLTIGKKLDLSWYGFWGYALMSSATVFDSIKIAIQFWDLTGELEKVTFKEGKETSALEITPSHPMVRGQVLTFNTEKWLCSTNASFSFLVGCQAPWKELRLVYDEPDYGFEYEKIFKCPVQFGCQETQLRFNSTLLKERLIMSNTDVAKHCTKQCEKALKELSESDELIDSIQRLIVNSPGISLKLDEISSKLGMSSRSLSRKLNSRDTTYQNILDKTRIGLAKEYLFQTDLSIDQIAELIGFSETTAFRRAFKRWTGSSASEFRKNALKET